MKIRYKIRVKGIVQGVGYRYFCARQAERYDITGYAKNLVDGSVEVDATGDKGLVLDFIKELRTGPSNSRVTSVTMDELPPEDNSNEFLIF